MKNKMLKVTNTIATALEPPTRKDLVTPRGIIKVNIVMLNKANKPLMLKSNINCVLIFNLINF